VHFQGELSESEGEESPRTRRLVQQSFRTKSVRLAREQSGEKEEGAAGEGAGFPKHGKFRLLTGRRSSGLASGRLSGRMDRSPTSLEHQTSTRMSHLQVGNLPHAKSFRLSLDPGSMEAKKQNLEQVLLEAKHRLVGKEEVFGVTVSFKNVCVSHETSCFGKKHKSVEVLKEVSGVIPAGRMTLLLGAPHSGKTQLLHALCRYTPERGAVYMSGDVHYNAFNTDDIFPTNFGAMVEQTDMHLGMLTVRETLEFANYCRNAPISQSSQVYSDDVYV
jgi:ABC-type multidrug transport system fused ATPase/permease subunit